MLTNSDIAKKRYEICKSCEFFTDTKRCSKCHCFMKMKTMIAAASCPVGKWKAEEIFKVKNDN
jgi:hypothetical protein